MANCANLSEPTLRWAAGAFAALSHPTRLVVFRFLLAQTGEVALEGGAGVRPVQGSTVGDLCCRVSGSRRVTPNLSQHIRVLADAGLIETRRHGRHVVCSARPEAADILRGILSADQETPRC
ncbi:MAG: helix-turn-helix domain-containing protein [Fimbriimonadales bacterium]|nr:helix-turn-helix domain-containing protein [Fimbriimonadales bacterium]